MDHRSPLENIFNIIGGLPHGHDKPVKHALYNAVALFLLFLGSAAAWGLYIILEPFIKPLIWALLVGSVLHPLKHSLREHFSSWISSIESSRTPIVLGLFILPFNVIHDLSEFIGGNLLKYLKIIVAGCLAVVVLFLVYYYTPRFIISIVANVAFLVLAAIELLIDNVNFYILSIFVVFYVSALVVCWKPDKNNIFHYVSVVMWLFLSCFLAHLFKPYHMPVFLVLQVIFYGGFVSEVYEVYTEINESACPGHKISLLESISWVFHNKSELEKDVVDVPIVQEGEEIAKAEEEPAEGPEKAAEHSGFGDSSDLTVSKSSLTSTPSVIKNPWSLELFDDNKPKPDDSPLSNASILITTKGSVHVIPEHSHSGIVARKVLSDDLKIKRSLSQPYVNCGGTYYRYRPKTFFLNKKRSKTSSVPSSIAEAPYASDFYLYTLLWACFVMLFWKNLMLLPVLSVPILIYSVKHVGYYLGVWGYLHGYFVQGMDVFCRWGAERFDALVPAPIRGLCKAVEKANNSVKDTIKDSIDTVASCVVIALLIIFVTCSSIFIVFQIYTEAIMLAQMFTNVINQTVVHNPELRQILPPTWDDTVDSILDNAYQYGREGISKAVRSMLNDVDSAKSVKLELQVLELWDRVYQTWMASDDDNGPKVTPAAVKSSWDAFLHDIQKSPEMFNISGLTEFIKQNIGTLMSLLESVWSIVKGNISLVLGSFSAFLSVLFGGGTAVLNFILNMIVFLTTLFYLLSSSGELYKPVELMTNVSTSGSRFGLALEGAVNGVFRASFRMAAFYGLWTWFIHNLFGVKIVYLPSAFATILGAVPFLGTYWACIPAVLDLWLAQGQGLLAILFAIFQFLPTSVVDTTIYKEIRGGGHPYLTGLAIAGGIFCLGVEGAIVGPLLLCGLYVAMDLSSSLFKDSPSEESLNLRLNLQEN